MDGEQVDIVEVGDTRSSRTEEQKPAGTSAHESESDVLKSSGVSSAQLAGHARSGAANREEHASLVSRATLWFLNSLLILGAQRPLVEADLDAIHSTHETARNRAAFEREWQAECARAAAAQGGAESASVWRALKRSVGGGWWVYSLVYIVYVVSSFLPPLVINLLVQHLEGTSVLSSSQQVLLAASILVVPFVGAVAFSVTNQGMQHIAWRARAAIIGAVYAKSLRLNSAARSAASLGEIVNIMSNDSQKLTIAVPNLNMLWGAPIQLAVALYLLYQQIGVSTFVGLGFLVALFPFNGFVFAHVVTLRRKMLKHTDARVKIMNELLSGIRVVKMYAWEMAIRARVLLERESELRYLFKSALTIAVGFIFVLLAAPQIMPVLVFSTYTKSGNELDAATAFTTLSLFALIRFPFSFLPMVLQQTTVLIIALRRVSRFLSLPELEVLTEEQLADLVPMDDDNAIEIEDGEFTWGSPIQPLIEKKKKMPQAEEEEAAEEDDIEMQAGAADEPAEGFTLRDINVSFPKGKVTCVVGPVACGKSTLISAILGECISVGGTVRRRSTPAYCAQEAFIINDSLRNNIVFDLTGGTRGVDEERYERVISACAMTDDLQQLRDGDLTEIGERGINLSGGQKARVSIARAVYNDAEVYILDNPLAAVDPHVSDHIFNNVIKGMLADKSVIFVTNQLQYLSQCDKVVVMSEGRIVEQGTFDELMSAGLDFQQLIKRHAAHHDGSESEDETEGAPRPRSSHNHATSEGKATAKSTRRRGGAGGKAELADELITAEELARGTVETSAYATYFKAIGGVIMVAMITLWLMSHATKIGSTFWLSEWSEEFVEEDRAGSKMSSSRVDYYIWIYTVWSLASALFIMLRAVLVAVGRVRAARAMHEMLFDRILRAPLRFFDTTPIGRILNRFSRDVETVDMELGPTFSQYGGTLFACLAAIVAIAVATKGIFLPALVPILVAYYFVQLFFRRSSTEIRRLDSVSRSPIFAHFSETLNGIATIRAYDCAHLFHAINHRLVDANTRIAFLYVTASNWLSMRLDILTALIAFSVATIALLRDDLIPAGWAGLALVFAFEMSKFLKHMVRMSAEVESNMNSVERIQYYTETVEQEALPVIESNRPPKGWPSRGVIEVRDLVVSYKPGEPVLKRISFDVQAGEKIGVCGRTGSGKSTTALALLRLVEPESGVITIDGVATMGLGLDDLRSRIGIIPQDPFLTSDTIRRNVDPFDEFEDDVILRALELVRLREYVESSGGLDALVSEGGENFSAGQRQLMCLARVLVRKPKILILDEATAATDVETDHAIQRLLRSEQFADTSIITIAHRLKTIMDCDRMLVLNSGRVAQFGSPIELLEDKEGLLASMVSVHGERYAEVLRSVARGERDVTELDDIEDANLDEELGGGEEE